jgi:hypothetical protein
MDKLNMEYSYKIMDKLATKKKSGEQAHPPLHGMGPAHVAATFNGCMQP